jgi:hypothetical protein
VPVVSRFYGIAIVFYWEEHLPPHFHAKYAGDEGMIDINTGALIQGSLPRRVLSLVNEWRVARQAELIADWERARRRMPLAYIEPLE